MKKKRIPDGKAVCPPHLETCSSLRAWWLLVEHVFCCLLPGMECWRGQVVNLCATLGALSFRRNTGLMETANRNYIWGLRLGPTAFLGLGWEEEVEGD